MPTNGNVRNKEKFKNLDYRNIKNKQQEEVYILRVCTVHCALCSYNNQINRGIKEEKNVKISKRKLY